MGEDEEKEEVKETTEIEMGTLEDTQDNELEAQDQNDVDDAFDHMGDEFDKHFNKLFEQLDEVRRLRDLRLKEEEQK